MNLKKTKEVEKLQFVERMRYKKTYKNHQKTTGTFFRA